MLLTKQIGIVTPLILSIVVCVALRLISYRRELPDCIIQVIESDSYCTGYRVRFVLYMGFGVRGKEKVNEAVQRICVIGEV